MLRSVVATVGMLLVSHAVASAQPVSGESALPGARRMVLLDRPASLATVALSGQYGFTASVLREDDSHHRLAGRVALALHPVDALSIGLSMNGRWDQHRGGSGADTSIVGDPRLSVLLRLVHAGAFRLGLGAELWAPGRDEPGIVASALSPSGTLHAQVDLESVTFALRVGYLHDRSARTIPDGRVYQRGDQVSLGVTEADAVLLGLGGTAHVGAVDLYAEVSLDALVRRDDLPFSASRAAATLGAMLTVGSRYHLGLEATVNLGSYPTLRSEAPYRVEPRVSVGLTLAADLGALRRTATDTAEEADDDDAPDAEEESASPAGRSLRGRVSLPAGAAPRAHVTVLSGGEPAAETDTNADGTYELTNLPPGPLTLVVEAVGQATSRTEIGADVDGEFETITLTTALPDGEIRGSVRGPQNVTIPARIVVESTGQTLDADAEGRFAITVAPGEHLLHIEAPGVRPQDRRVTVEDSGVVVIEIHLRPL